MALHTGETLERDGDYYGRTVNRAARLRSIADGDRPLVSATTAQLLADALPEGLHLVELGMRELRDLDRPELVYLLVDDELPARVASDDLTPIELPFALVPPPRLRSAPLFVGRAEPAHRLQILAQLAERGNRQIAVVGGEPGIGKTALAAQAAMALHDAGWLVLHGRCDAARDVPFQAFAEALDFLAREAPGRAGRDRRDRGARPGRAAPPLRPRSGARAPGVDTYRRRDRPLLRDVGRNPPARSAGRHPADRAPDRRSALGGRLDPRAAPGTRERRVDAPARRRHVP